VARTSPAKKVRMRKRLDKMHGVTARGTIDSEQDGTYIAYVIVSDGHEKQVRGPAIWATATEARFWIIRQAAIHGFDEKDIVFEAGRDATSS
jgi:hypothetical protein